jgi:hypothetical protein
MNSGADGAAGESQSSPDLDLSRSGVSAPEELKAALEEAEAELAFVYRKLWPLREAYAEAVPPADLPRKVNRTAKQERISRCPRCGSRDDMEHIRQIILRGWDDHMWNFEMMSEKDEYWLLRWAGHPLAEYHSVGKELLLESEQPPE